MHLGQLIMLSDLQLRADDACSKEIKQNCWFCPIFGEFSMDKTAKLMDSVFSCVIHYWQLIVSAFHAIFQQPLAYDKLKDRKAINFKQQTPSNCARS